MWPNRVSNPGPLALEADALPTALRGAARLKANSVDKEVYTLFANSAIIIPWRFNKMLNAIIYHQISVLLCRLCYLLSQDVLNAHINEIFMNFWHTHYTVI